MKKNLRIKVINSCGGRLWWFGICENRKEIMSTPSRSRNCSWYRKSSAIRNAKAMAELIGIKYDPEIIKQHGC